MGMLLVPAMEPPEPPAAQVVSSATASAAQSDLDSIWLHACIRYSCSGS